MKKLTLLLATVATLFSTSLFTSCSEPESTEPTIVGTWEYKETEDDWTGTMTFVFNADGSGCFTIKETESNASYQQSVSLEYTYNKETSFLTLIPDGYLDSEWSDILFDGEVEAHITTNKMRLDFSSYDYDYIIFTRAK